MEQNFDLLGDPIPEGFGMRGRPPHTPTDENRNKVMVLLAMGRGDDTIARTLGITKPTLKKHYFRQLKVRGEARDRVDGIRIMALWGQVREGNVAAMKEFNRLMERVDLEAAENVFTRPAEDKQIRDSPETDVPPLPLGKKDQQQRAAESAGVGTDWGTDLLPDDGRTKH